MKNVLITGGAGFIGSNLVDSLIDNNRVTVIDDFNDFYDPVIKRSNLAHHLKRGEIKLVEANICDRQAIDSLFAREKFDCVVHLAARAGVRPSLQNPPAYAETNVTGTYVLLDSASRYGVSQFVFGSSSSVYGVTSQIPFNETDPLSAPISPYAATKIAGEIACKVFSNLYDMRVVCLRFFTAYGPRQRPDLVIHKFARMIMNEQPLPVFGDGCSRRDYTYIDDLVAGVLAAMDFSDSKYEIFNLGESRTVELNRVIELLAKALGKQPIIEYLPEQPGDVPLTHADITKARRVLGYNPRTDIETGIEKFAGWLREQLALAC